MAYREDTDLEFLEKCELQDLQVLVGLITKEPTEELTDTDEYNRNRPHHNKYWKLIAAEIQSFGGHSIVNMFRGGGVLYREVLTDVCDRITVAYNDSDHVTDIERNLLAKVLTQALSKMNYDELSNVVASIGLKTKELDAKSVAETLNTSLEAGVRSVHQWVDSIAEAATVEGALKDTIVAIIFGLVGRAVFGPIAWVTLVTSFTSTAYRVTIPLVIQVAYMRAKMHYKAF
jgi:uncharacterized protein YaaW (UPF0174 family)